MCSSVKCERYKKIGDFLEGSDSDVEFKCDNCLIQKRNRTKVESSCGETSWGGEKRVREDYLSLNSRM